MLVEVTYKCSMGCSHCMSDCKSTGKDMEIDLFHNVLEFLKKHNINIWNFSGGEIFEHENILDILNIIESEATSNKVVRAINIMTNGRPLVRNREIYDRVVEFRNNLKKKNIFVQIQVTDDSRFYPDPLSDKEKYWLSKIAIIDEVPGYPGDKHKCLYPQGRALNYPENMYYTNAPKCINCKLLVEQGINTLEDMCAMLFSHNKLCTPVIAPDGSIKIGESALCPPVATIYDSDHVIMKKIKNFNCMNCKYAWNRLKETNPTVYNYFVSRKEEYELS